MLDGVEIFIMLVVVLFIGALILGVVITCLEHVLLDSDVFVRVDYTGIENLMHDPYEYYATSGMNGNNKSIPILEKRYGEEVAKASIYDDTDVNYYYAELKCTPGKVAAEHAQFVEPDSIIETSLGDEYIISFSKWTQESDDIDAQDKMIIKQVIEKLHDGNVLDRVSEIGDGEEYGLTYIMLVEHNGRYYVEHENSTLYKYDETGLSKLLTVPKDGKIGYYIFVDRYESVD